MSTENPSEPPILFPNGALPAPEPASISESFVDFESQLRACFERGEISIQTFDLLLASYRQTQGAQAKGTIPSKPNAAANLFPARVNSANNSWTTHTSITPVPTLYPTFEAIAWKKLREALDEKTYGAPRVFDLFTLMAVTLAFGLLFALLKALGSSEDVFICTTFFITIVAVCQMIMFGGDKPRLASLAGGPIAMVVVLLGWGIWSQASFEIFVLLLFMTIPFGIPAGYLTGGVVAGVFLLADEFRKRYGKQLDENETERCELDDVVPSTKQRLE
jgi:hypothetical protein